MSERWPPRGRSSQPRPDFKASSSAPCVETPERYLLLVTWDKLEDHTIGFRQSSRYQQWRELLHGFYAPFPTVEHYGPPI